MDGAACFFCEFHIIQLFIASKFTSKKLQKLSDETQTIVISTWSK